MVLLLPFLLPLLPLLMVLLFAPFPRPASTWAKTSPVSVSFPPQQDGLSHTCGPEVPLFAVAAFAVAVAFFAVTAFVFAVAMAVAMAAAAAAKTFAGTGAAHSGTVTFDAPYTSKARRPLSAFENVLHLKTLEKVQTYHVLFKATDQLTTLGNIVRVENG
ncbi:hypothetical protein K435DRAFT_808306 [Dendrothele bispora CBS 962.96]|uniref:Uncharacterized protein n=1 Tax=Dendrothele bispora (strain CBS 962.96) TaxID=1314807 RepID=A0A4S8L1W3_DENBC|nr:hypothetical protein K435DRAFT_808306 [Dendrothele bispora CBS 962.96]